MKSLSFTVDDSVSAERIDVVIAKTLPDFSRSRIQKIIGWGGVTVNGKTAGKSAGVSAGDTVEIVYEEASPPVLGAQNIPLDIRYEDSDVLVVNKPKGMVVHPAAGHYEGTLVNALLHYCGDSLSGINGVARPGIVHRIDKDTSGLLLVAKNDCAHNSLSSQLKAHTISREYRAVVLGRFRQFAGTVNLPIGRHPKDRKRMCVTDKNSKNAVTHYEVIEEYSEYSYLRLRLETGRTHQIRVHMAHIGHPLAGDTVYGAKRSPGFFDGQCLHAYLLGFTHPRTGEYIERIAELPDYFKGFLRSLNEYDASDGS